MVVLMMAVFCRMTLSDGRVCCRVMALCHETVVNGMVVLMMAVSFAG